MESSGSVSTARGFGLYGDGGCWLWLKLSLNKATTTATISSPVRPSWPMVMVKRALVACAKYNIGGVWRPQAGPAVAIGFPPVCMCG